MSSNWVYVYYGPSLMSEPNGWFITGVWFIKWLWIYWWMCEDIFLFMKQELQHAWEARMWIRWEKWVEFSFYFILFSLFAIFLHRRSHPSKCGIIYLCRKNNLNHYICFSISWLVGRYSLSSFEAYMTWTIQWNIFVNVTIIDP